MAIFYFYGKKTNMTPYQLSKSESRYLQEINELYYMIPALQEIERRLASADNCSERLLMIWDELYEIMVQCKPQVDLLLEERKAKGNIKDVNQARKSVAGNLFSNLIIYLFIQSKILGHIKPDIFITSKLGEVPQLKDLTTIHVDTETQKPDMDLAVYAFDEQESLRNCLILSLKTSLRERAGQTYKWKLLLEIANTENAIKQKYGIRYEAPFIPKIGFVTVNFYNEINNPQHRGMFKFFDASFIGKNITSDFIAKLSELPAYVNREI